MAVVRGERGSVNSAAFWTSLTGGGIGRGATEEAGDSLERLTEAEDIWNEWGMLRQCAIDSLLSLHRGFSGGTPELAVAHVPVWQAPMCCRSQDSPFTSGGIGAGGMAHDAGGCGWTPLHTVLLLQLDQGVAESSSVLTREFQYME